jgi:hypothetical protein
LHPWYFAKIGKDRIQDGDEDFLHTGIRLNVTRQGFLNVSHGRGHEAWLGKQYRTGNEVNIFGNIQALRWLNLSGSFGRGPAIFYDETDPFQGRSRRYNIETTIQPNQHLSQNLEYTNVRFTGPAKDQLVYDLDIINSKTTYQFDKHFLARMLVQYDSSRDRVLTDFLASYEFVPGTVFHVGYGSLYEKGFGFVEPVPGLSNPLDRDNRFVMVNRGLFLKASYLRRF